MEELEAKVVGTEQQSDGTKVVKFDASQYEMLDFAPMNVLDVSQTRPMLHNGQPVIIDVWSPGSKEGVKYQHAANRASALKTAALFRGRMPQPTGAEQDKEKVDKLVAITKEVHNFPYEGGVRAMYANPLLTIGDQVDAFYNDKANFAKPSTEN